MDNKETTKNLFVQQKAMTTEILVGKGSKKIRNI